MSTEETFASRLSTLIKEKGVSHAEIGRVVGVSGQAVGKWAKGGNIEYDNLRALAKFFDVNWIWLRYGDDAMISFSERRTGSKARRAVIKQILDNEERLRLALEAAEIGTWDFNLISDQVALSPVAERLMGIDDANFHGNKDELLECVAAQDRSRVDEALTAVLDHQTSEFDITHHLAGGQGCLRQQAHLITDDLGRPIRVVGVVTQVANA
jgi:PAS domain-containing protein